MVVLVHRWTIAAAWSRHTRGSMKMGMGRETGEKGGRFSSLHKFTKCVDNDIFISTFIQKVDINICQLFFFKSVFTMLSSHRTQAM
jgi:hypothetical protein